MAIIKGYAHYGVLAHEKQIIFSSQEKHENSTLDEKMEIEIPDEFETYKNAIEETIIKTPEGQSYRVQDIIPAWRITEEPKISYYNGKSIRNIKCKIIK